MINNVGEVLENYDLTNNNTYNLKCTCKYIIYPRNKVELINLIKYINDKNLNYFVLGNGSNVIFNFEYYDGIVISLKYFNELEILNNGFIKCGAGVMLPIIAKKSIDNGYKGLEWAIGIPGTIGGSIHGNAGAYLKDIMEYTISVDVIDKNGNLKTFNKEDITYGYRTTLFKENKDYIIISVILKLEKGNKEESLKLVEDRHKRRLESQPLNYPSAGSVFRNPSSDNPAGKLIEEANFKGKSIGGAKVSEKHANFIINNGGATGEDIVKLIELIKKEIKNKNNIELICEQEIIKGI